MDFNVQSIEMKITLLEASVGQVTIAVSVLEANLKLCISLFESNNNGDEFEKQYNKFRTLGLLVKDATALNIFDPNTISALKVAKDRRNNFSHALYETYAKSIDNNESMFQLVNEFRELAKYIDEVTVLVVEKLNKIAEEQDIPMDEINKKAKSDLNRWEHA